MALIVEDGTGRADAESYGSVAEVVAVLTKYGEHTAFAALASTVQEQHCRKATRRMDLESSYRGVRKTETQALAWPREYAEDDDGYVYDADSLPTRLKEAHAFFAAESVAGDLQPNETTPATIESESVKVGPISESITYEGGKSSSAYYRKALTAMRGLVEPAGILERA